MQQMQTTTDIGPEACAALLLDVVPPVMRTIRSYMREARAADLSVPQFRALAFLNTHPGATLSDVAEHVGLTLPASSRMIDGLVARKYAERQPSKTSRRCIELRLSADGHEMLEFTRRHTQDALASLLAPLAAPQRAAVTAALETLKLAFGAVPGSGDLPVHTSTAHR
ncbi:MAG: MarR family winged helix-turn-helix transcriptional regulator [Ktedonobacterales bacterium]